MRLQAYTVSRYNFDECMKCTVCSVYCPVLQVNPLYPGPKQAGPDGERLRLKDPYFFNYALKYCLNCKRCEVACPSGVDVAGLIQAARIKYGQDKPTLRDRMLASTDLMGSLARPVAHVVNGLTGLRVTRAAMDAALKIDHRRVFPKYSGRSFESWLKRQAHAQAAFPEQVAYFHGCYVNYNYPQLGKDLVKVLNALGVGVQLLDKEKCCGIAYITNGMSDIARKNAVHNVAALEEALSRKVEMKESDGMEARQIKAMVEGMKDELRRFVSAGGTIEQYGRRLVARQDDEIAIYTRACNEVEQAVKSGMGKTEIAELVDRRNDELRRMGVKLIAMPETVD